MVDVEGRGRALHVRVSYALGVPAAPMHDRGTDAARARRGTHSNIYTHVSARARRTDMI